MGRIKWERGVKADCYSSACTGTSQMQFSGIQSPTHAWPHPCMAPPTHDIFFPSAECGEAMVHRHCRDRAPPCKAHIASGAYVTMSRKKVIKSLDDIDRLGKFLLDKVREEL